MRVLLEGHRIKEDLLPLLNIIFNKDEIEFIDDILEYKSQGKLLRLKLFKDRDIEFMEASLYNEGKEVSTSKINVDLVEVYINDIKKKRNVAVKRAIITATNYFDKLPWGILTGIRPMKIVHNLIEKGISQGEIRRVFKDEYLLHDDKINSLMDTLREQGRYIKENQNRYSLYISIPFCPTRCLYCSFPALAIDRYSNYIKEYVETLKYEIKSTYESMAGKEINTVYIGGGTPTALDEKYLEEIIVFINEVFGRDNISEFTVEAGRPDTLNKSYLDMLKRNRVDRISINPQTMSDRTLKLIGRNHRAEDVIKIYQEARKIGFSSINMDIIIGLPGEKLEDIIYTLNEIETLEPENITIHTLAVKTNSRFKRTMDEYEIELEGDMEGVSSIISKFIKRNDYKPYYLYRQKNSLSNLENVGYSKKDKLCRYNISMMEERETIIALGMGGVSKIYMGNGKIKRIPNFKGLNDYLTRVDELITRRNIQLKVVECGY